MKMILALVTLLTLSACRSRELASRYNTSCQPTAVLASDLRQINFEPQPGKIQVVRILRTSCPSCKADLEKIGALFQSGEWDKNKVQLLLIGYNKPGLESRASFDTFVRQKMSDLGIPMESVQIVWLNRSYPSLLQTKSASGETLFQNWRVVPYGMIFAADGRLVFRDQFTTSSEAQDHHYKAVSLLQNESCPSSSATK